MKKITLITKILLTLVVTFASLSAVAQSPQTYDASGTFTVPAGVTQVTVEAWGAGGHGGSRSGSAGGSGGGGGGAYARKVISVTAGSTYTVNVGTGSTTNSPGGDSWFNTNSTILAKGGNSVDLNNSTGALGGNSALCIGTTVYSGGNGKDGIAGSYGGGGGSSAGTSSPGNNATDANGALAPSGGGSGGNGRTTSGGGGITGEPIGGSGGGSYTTGNGTQTGGNGKNGQVIINWLATGPYCAPTYTNGPGTVDQITNVTLGTLSNTSGGSSSPFYTFYNAVTIPNINISGIATVNITFGSDSNQYAAVWIDFNQDNIFQASEGFISSNAGANGTAILNIPVPAGAILGNTRMRIRGGDDVALTTTQACGASGSTYGETEDYIVNVVATSAPTITTLGSTSGCEGTSITINGLNLSGATAVKIGGTNVASITSNSATQIVAVIGAGTTGKVSVTTGGGTAVSTATFTVNLAATVNAGSTLSNICKGSSTVALGGSFGGSATSAIWSSSVGGGTFSNNSGSTPNTTIWTPPAAYTGTATLTLTTSGGSCGLKTATKTQIVESAITASVSSAITVNGSLTSPSLGGDLVSGNWTTISGPSGTVTFSNASSGSSTATVSIIGTYVFRWTVSNSCGSSFAEVTVTYLDANYHRDYTLFNENFDSSDGGWTNTTSTNGSWVRTDVFPGVSEIGENSFWRTDNFNDYSNNAIIEITSPVYNFTGFENLQFNIDIRYRTQNNTDGMRILYSVNNGAFVVLGSSGNGINWYNSATVSALGGSGWSNNSATAALSFTPVGIGPNRFIRATTGLADATFRNQSNVRFKIEFRSDASVVDDGVAFDNVLVEGNAIVPIVASPIAPAKVNQNLSLWFKSNAGIGVTDGSPLTLWQDQAYDTSRADLINKEDVRAIITDAPTYRDNSARNINFNPVVDFNSANKDYMNGKGGLYSQDYFLVVYSDDIVQNTMGSNGRQTPIGGKSDEQSFHEDPTGLGLGNTTARYSLDEVIAHNVGAYVPGTGSPTPGVDSFGRAFSSSTVTYNEPIIINVKTNANGTDTEIYKNGVKIDNQAARTGNSGTGALLNFYEYKNLPFYIGTGRSGISGRNFSALNGRLSEVVVYTSPNSALNQQKIQSYLGLKYGITLHSTTSTNDSGVSTTTRLNDVNYIDSSGNIIWNTATNSGFNYDIAGIGRDDDSQLYQKQSKSVNSSDDITIGLTTIATTNNLNTNSCNNKNFLVWGNNNGTLAAQPAVIVNMSAGITPSLTTNVDFISIGRTWKVVEVGGNVPITKVSLPTTMLSATITPPGDYLMFISNTPAFDPTAEYRVLTVNGSNLETSYDFDGTKYITFGFAPERTFVRSIAFNGINNYLDAGKVLNLNTSFTVSAWVKRNGTNQTILSKRDNAFSSGYDLSINSAGKAEMKWINGSAQTITSSVAIPAGIWHNIAVTYNGTSAKLYIDGVLDVTKSLATVPSNNQSFLIAAADGTNPTSFYNGNIDEVRVWNITLTDKQLRYVMNQEILSNGLATNGAIVPNTIALNDISSIPWSNLSAYYPMSTYTYTNAKDISINNYTASLRNLSTVDRQTAPLPYLSSANGPWSDSASWSNGTTQDLPYSLSIIDGVTPIAWNIVRTIHNIDSAGNKTVIGLFVDSNTLSETNNTSLEVTHYLKLTGKIDLVGKSQLIQRLNSELDATSAGSIERDQLGQKTIYNYNYWSSPVGTINNTSNNNNFTVAGVMKDGTTATPQNLLWTGSYNGSPTTPAVTLSTYWIYKFTNLSNTYANWQYVGQNGTLKAAEGFTLKGSGTALANQTYTFVGKPNNGSITAPIAANNLNLVGNPYPSALDATAFINANLTSTTGVLYFWEHYSTNNSHNLAAYQGGYATKTLTGATPPAAPAGISGLGSSAKTPKQYIPVGQGFFVEGSATGGTITFNNNQREFVKEDNATSFTLFKNNSDTTGTTTIDVEDTHFNYNQDFQAPLDTFKRVRLGMTSVDDFHREILIGFMDNNATSAIDPGYDAINIDEQPNEIYFMNSGKKLTIAGEGYFDVNTSYPLGVTTNNPGNVKFTLDGKENLDTNQDIFIYDNVTNTYNSISETQDYVVNLPQATIENRFFLTFKNTALLGVGSNNLESGINIAYSNTSAILAIANKTVDTTIETVGLFNILGQQVGNYDVKNQTQTNIVLPLKQLAIGTYIVKMNTDKGATSRKIIIN